MTKIHAHEPIAHAPKEHFAYRLATPNDHAAILEFMVQHFYPAEPCSQALGIAIEELRPIYSDLIVRCLQFPFSTIVTSESDDVVGILVNSIWKREDVDGEGADYEMAESQSEALKKFVGILNECHSDFWSLAPPEVHVVIHREVSCVAPSYQRRGIATRMLTANMEPQKLVEFGVDGVISETSSKANQVLLERHGFRCLKEIPYATLRNGEGEELEASDGTKGLRLNLKLIGGFEQ